MADVSEELVKILENDSEITALVGDRIYPQHLPENTSYKDDSPDLPAIHYGSLSDPESDPIPLRIEQWQFTVTARNYLEMRSVVKAFRKCMHRYKGGMFKYIGYTGGTDSWDSDNKRPYNPMTIQCTVFDKEGM